MTSYGTFVSNLIGVLQPALNVELVPGVLTGRQPRELGCVWSPGKVRVDPATDEVIEARVRIFQGYDEAVAANTEIPWDPSPLYALADTLQQTVKANRTSVGTWFIWWESTQIDEEDQGLEAVIMGRQANLAETYG